MGDPNRVNTRERERERERERDINFWAIKDVLTTSGGERISKRDVASRSKKVSRRASGRTWLPFLGREGSGLSHTPQINISQKKVHRTVSLSKLGKSCLLN